MSTFFDQLQQLRERQPAPAILTVRSENCGYCPYHAEYEILNQKYSKEDYFKKVAEIREELKREGSYGRWWWPSPYPEQPSAYLG